MYHFQATKLKVQLMKAFGDFKLIQTEKYSAISLPTEENGSFVVALPNDNIDLASVEAEIIKNGQSIDAFVEAVNSAEKTKEYTVLLPKLSIQIIHEWSTPSNKVAFATIFKYRYHFIYHLYLINELYLLLT